ncbi:nucleoside triphosphate pyrophosphohydrolase [Chloroflexota bacterium]
MDGRLFIRPSDLEMSFPAIVGQKAKNLSTLPICWVPEYFVISSILYERWEEKGNISDLLSREEYSELNTSLKSLGHSGECQMIVRSSAADEGLKQRGTYLSNEIRQPDSQKILVGINSIFSQASQNTSKTPEGIKLAVIVQELKEIIHLGHLSNERRVARRIQDWVYEFAAGNVGNFAIKSHYANADPKSTLKASNRKELIRALRNIATYFDDLQQRRHLEWVWDGSQVWLVQGDFDIDILSTDPRKFLRPNFPVQHDYRFQILKHWSNADSKRWSKIENQVHFKEAGLPTYPLWVLEDQSTLSEIGKNNFPTQITSEISRLARYPIVVRMDTNKQNEDIEENLDLPRSNTLNSGEKIHDFILTKTKGFLSHCSPRDFCFILHQYVPSKSSAFSLSLKDNPRVSIDSLWGIADGLQYFSHDSFEYDTSIGALVRDDPGYKQEYLAPDHTGDWKFVYSGKPWDWGPSLNTEEIRSISKGAVALSKLLKKNLVIMWFVGIPKSTNMPNAIPWWYTEIQDIPEMVSPSDKSVFNRRIIQISTQPDLTELESLHNQRDSTIKLIPRPELLREKEFINRIIQISKARDLTIEMGGSPLCHAYYQLRRAGVKVSCEDRLYRKSKIFRTKTLKPKKFDKLVRDKIPQIITNHGEQVSTLKVEDRELVKALKEKVIEESYELFWSDNEISAREELSDLYEVIMTLARLYHISPAMIQTSANKKRKAKGAFEDGTYLLQTIENPLTIVEDRQVLIPASQLGFIPKPRNIPEFKNNRLSVSIIPPSVQPIKIKLPERTKQSDESGYILVRYEGKKIIIEFMKTTKPE